MEKIIIALMAYTYLLMTWARVGKGTKLFHTNILLSGGGECYNYNLFQSVSNHCKKSCIERRNRLHLRWLYMIFWRARNRYEWRECSSILKKNFYFDDVTKRGFE